MHITKIYKHVFFCSTEVVSVTLEIVGEAADTLDREAPKDHAGLGRTAQRDAIRTETGQYFNSLRSNFLRMNSTDNRFSLTKLNTLTL